MPVKIPKFLALAALCPFLLAFSPPEEAGDYVSFSGGQGRSVSVAGCSRPKMTEYTEAQVGAYRQYHLSDGGTRLGLGADAHLFLSRDKECVDEDCRGGDWLERDPRFALSPYATGDWEWIGLSAGTHLTWKLITNDGPIGNTSEDWAALPGFGHIRAGRLDLLYGSVELLGGRPLHSGGFLHAGIGGRIAGTDLWIGSDGIDNTSSYAARVSRGFGPVRLRLAGRFGANDYSHTDDSDGGSEPYRVRVPDYALSAGLDWRLPF